MLKIKTMTDKLLYLKSVSQSAMTKWNPDGCLVPWTIIFKDLRTCGHTDDWSRYWKCLKNSAFFNAKCMRLCPRMLHTDFNIFVCVSVKCCQWCPIESWVETFVTCYHLHLWPCSWAATASFSGLEWPTAPSCCLYTFNRKSAKVLAISPPHRLNEKENFVFISEKPGLRLVHSTTREWSFILTSQY